MKKIFSGILKGFAVFLIYVGVNLVFWFPLIFVPFLISFRSGQPHFDLYRNLLVNLLYVVVSPIITYKLVKRFSFFGLSEKIVKRELVLLVILVIVDAIF